MNYCHYLAATETRVQRQITTHYLVHPHRSLVSLCVECSEERGLERRVLSRPLLVAVHFARR